MQRGDPAGMACVPGLEHVERFGAPHLPDYDPVGPKAKGRAHEFGHADDARSRAQRDGVRRRALQLAGVLDEDDPFVEPGHFGEQRVREGRLS
ncbi:hypothetical protein D3C73_1232920 [compost metagenome]